MALGISIYLKITFRKSGLRVHLICMSGLVGFRTNTGWFHIDFIYTVCTAGWLRYTDTDESTPMNQTATIKISHLMNHWNPLTVYNYDKVCFSSFLCLSCQDNKAQVITTEIVIKQVRFVFTILQIVVPSSPSSSSSFIHEVVSFTKSSRLRSSREQKTALNTYCIACLVVFDRIFYPPFWN